MTLLLEQPRTVREFDFTAGRFRTYLLCERCPQRRQYNSRTKTARLCRDCWEALSPAERKRWL